MKVIILAAGKGSRLGTIRPKPLTYLYKSKSILDFQIEKIVKIVKNADVTIVVGYKKEEIIHQYPYFTYIYNSEFSQTNTAKSLLLALEQIDDDVLFLNGDVYFDEEVLGHLLLSTSSACLVNTNKCSEEEIKYTVDEDGYIYELSKKVKNGKGEAVGINFLKKDDVDSIKKELYKVEDEEYFEKALENLTLAKKLRLKPIDISNYYCKEIDFPEDLQEVKEYIQRNFCS